MSLDLSSGRSVGAWQLFRPLGTLDSIRIWEAFGPTGSGAGLVRLLIRRRDAGGAVLVCAEAGLDHPHLRPVLGRAEVDGHAVVAVPPLQGVTATTLGEWLFSAESTLSDAALAELAEGVASGLQAASDAVDASGAPRFLIHGQLTADHVEIGSDGSVVVSGFAAPEGSQVVDRVALAGLLDALTDEPDPALAEVLDLLRLEHPPPGGYRPVLEALAALELSGPDLTAEVGRARTGRASGSRWRGADAKPGATRAQDWSKGAPGVDGSFTEVFEADSSIDPGADVGPTRVQGADAPSPGPADGSFTEVFTGGPPAADED